MKSGGQFAMVGTVYVIVGLAAGAMYGVPIVMWLETMPSGGCGMAALAMMMKGLFLGGVSGGVLGVFATMILGYFWNRPLNRNRSACVK